MSNSNVNSVLKEVLGTSIYILVVLLIALFTVKFIGQRTVVIGQSMERTLSNDSLGSAYLNTSSHLDSHGGNGILCGGSSSGLYRLIHQVLKFHSLLLVASGVHIGQVVGDCINICLLTVHAGGCCP